MFVSFVSHSTFDTSDRWSVVGVLALGVQRSEDSGWNVYLGTKEPFSDFATCVGNPRIWNQNTFLMDLQIMLLTYPPTNWHDGLFDLAWGWGAEPFPQWASNYVIYYATYLL